MDTEGSSAGERHVGLGQGILANNHSTLNVRDIHNYYGTHRPPQPTLRDLLSFPEMQRRERRVEVAHDGTCEWFVHTEEYSRWTENPRNDWRDNIIWVRGNAGAGKSTLMKFAVEHAREAAPGELVLPHFFNARGKPLEHSIEGMWRTLIVWLLDELPDELPEAAVDQLSSAYRRSPSKQWDVPELERLLKKAVGKATHRSITFYIDALDECNGQDVEGMLQSFSGIVKKAHHSGQCTRLCLASRPYPAITFTNAIFLNIHDQEEHLADIDQYIKDRLRIGNSELAITIQGDIRRKARGIFMWVVLVVNSLNTDFREGNIQNLQDRLTAIPGDLRTFFIYTLERYPQDRPAMLVCFRWLLFEEVWDFDTRILWWIMQLGLGRPDQEIVAEYEVLDIDAIERQLISKTKGFVEFEENECRFTHESIREFFLKESSLLGAEQPSEFEAKSHELIRDWWYAEVLACQPIVVDLVPKFDECGKISSSSDGFILLEKRPLGISAAEYALCNAEQVQKSGRDQAAWLKNFSHTTGPYIVENHETDEYVMFHDLMGLLLYSRCEALIRHTQLEPTYQGRCDGLAPGFKDIEYERECPALLAHDPTGPWMFSEALVYIYLNLEHRSSRLQSLIQKEATDRLLRCDQQYEPSSPMPLLNLAELNDRLATFFLLALTPPSALEPHLDRLESMFEGDDSLHLVRALHLIIEQKLPTDAIDCMSPSLLKWIVVEEEYDKDEIAMEVEGSKDVTELFARASTLAQMGAMLRSRGVQLPD